MNKLYRNIIAALAIILLLAGIWYFSWLVTYFLVAGVLSIVGRPLVDLLLKIKIKRFHFPKWLAALLTLVVIWFFLIGFIRVFFPLILNQASEISNIDWNQLLVKLEDPISKMNEIYQKYFVENQEDIQGLIIEKASSYFNMDSVSNIFGSITGFFGNIFIAAFAISFMTFFFLKDQSLFKDGLLIIIPDKFVVKVKHALSSIKRLLTRYFIGILIQISGIIIIVTLGLKFIAGISFEQALVFGLIAGIFNVIPYIGPIAGAITGLTLGLITHVNGVPANELGLLLVKMAIPYGIAQVIDNILFQPVIFSNSVNAHPLEIFIVIMMAGSLVGVGGMILAVPTYTVLRVFAKEFFNNFKVVKRLTEHI